MNTPEVDAAALRRLARGLLFDADAAGDVVQEAWLASLRRDPRAAPATGWLAGAVKRIALGRRRADARRRARESLAARPDPDSTCEDVPERLEVLRALIAALERLDDPYRAAVVMRYLDDLPPREIARRTGVPVDTARTHVRRGLERLRADLDGPQGRGREAFLSALLPLAGPEAWKLALASAPAAGGTTTLAGALIVKKTALSVVALLALLAVSWVALREPAEDRTEVAAEAVAELVTIDGKVTPSGPESIADETQERVEAVVAAKGPTWTQRGRLIVGSSKPLPHGRLLARVLRGAGLDGEVLHEQTLTADEAGRFTWTFDAPTELVTLALRGDLPRAVCITHWGTYAPGDPAYEPWEIVVLPLDLEVRGRVLGPDGRPASNARVVRRFVQSDNMAQCDGEGRFRLETTSAYASAEFRVLAEGLLGTRVQFMAPQGGGVLELPDVHLATARTLRGRVTDELGAPLAGAQVSNQSDFWGKLAESDVDGTFEFTGLDPERARSFLFARLDGRVPTQTLVTPDTTLCEIVLARGLSLTGRVVDEQGTPVHHAQIAFEAPFGTGDEPSIRSDVNGRFTLAPIPDGSRYIWISATGSARRRVKLELPTDVSAFDAGDIVLEPERTLRGRVLDADGAPLAWSVVWVERDGSISGPGSFSSQSTRTGEDGRFAIHELPSIPMTVGVMAEGHPRFERRLTEIDDAELELRLERGGALAGRVTDSASGAPIRRFRVTVTGDREAPPEHRLEYGLGAWHTGNWIEDLEGEWELEDDLPLDCWVDIEIVAEGYAPARIERVATVLEPDPAMLTFALVRDTFVQGRVVDPDGAPVGGARVSRLGRENDFQSTTDGTGRFELRGIPTGETLLSVAAEGFARHIDGPFELGAATQQRVILIDHGARLDGRLIGDGGKPMAGERIDLNAYDGNDREERRHVLTDAEGRYSFEGLAAGAFDLGWLRTLDGETWYAQTRLVRIAAMEAVRFDLGFSGSANVHGTIRSQVALPSSTRMRIMLYAEPDPEDMHLDQRFPSFTSITKETRTLFVVGERFEIPGLEPGKYVLSVQARPDPKTVSAHGRFLHLELTAGAAVEVDVMLNPVE